MLCACTRSQDEIALETDVIVDNQAGDEQLLKDLESPAKMAEAIMNVELTEEDALANGGNALSIR